MIHPPAYTVQMYASQLHTKHAHIEGMAARIDKAAAILIAGDVQADGSKFLVLSSEERKESTRPRWAGAYVFWGMGESALYFL